MRLHAEKALVTGATGFLGGRLVEKLFGEGARVRALVRDLRRAARVARFPIELVSGDVRDEAAMAEAARGCSVVVHCAYDFNSGPRTQRETCVRGAEALARAARHARVDRVVYVSSFAVYGEPIDGDLSESSPRSAARTAYSRYKKLAEDLLLDRARREGLPVVILQPTLIYGPFSRHWTIEPVRQLKTGLVPLVDGGEGLCNLVYVDDAVDGLVAAARADYVTGERFLISGGDPARWRDFYGAYESMLGRRATVEMRVEEVEEALRGGARREGTVPIVLGWLRDPRVLGEIARLPLFRASLRTARAVLSERQWLRLKESFFSSNGAGEGAMPIHLPDRSLLALQRSRVRVRIDKARELLGYRPRFDLRQGMAATEGFLRWARIIGSEP